MGNSQRTGVSTFASRTSPSTAQSLQKSFHLFSPDKIELKKISSPSENKKYPTAQPTFNDTTTQQGQWFARTVDRRPAYNSGFKKLAVQWLNENLCFVSSSVVADSFVLRNRQLLKPAFQDQIQIFKLKIYSFPHKAFLC
jgi:hypothetical protein